MPNVRITFSSVVKADAGCVNDLIICIKFSTTCGMAIIEKMKFCAMSKYVISNDEISLFLETAFLDLNHARTMN
jgi:hypothetical protein